VVTAHDDPDVIDRAVRAALEATSPASLLPDRSQARGSSLSGVVTVLDALDLGHDSSGRQAIVAVVRVAAARR
jgi:hypothetical protein